VAQVEATGATSAAETTSIPLPATAPATPAAGQAAVETPGASETPEAAFVETPAPQKYYTEEFTGDLASWPYFLTQGNESAVKFFLDGGRLYFQLQQQDEGSPRVYLVNSAFSYADVRVETFTTNNGVNANGVSLICRYSGAGWYEFTVSNSGEYTISAYDAEGRFYYDLAVGGSPAVNTGLSTNVYAAICKGGDLTLVINGEIITTTFDRRFNFTEGLIGLGVASPRGLPVNVDFDYIKVSEP
jgi:hypothetical protein